MRELQSLIDYGRDSPALPSGHPFTGVQEGAYRSSTTFAYDTTFAWYVDLGEGKVRRDSKALTLYVWLVRGGQ